MCRIILLTIIGLIVIPKEFYVRDIPSNITLILGKRWINNMKVMPSTRHRCLKFPVLDTIVTTEGDPAFGDPECQATLPIAQPAYTGLSTERIFDYGFNP